MFSIGRRFVSTILVAGIALLPASSFSDVTIVTTDNHYATAMAKKVQAGLKDPSTITYRLDPSNRSSVIIALGIDAIHQPKIESYPAIVSAFINYSDSAQIGDSVMHIIYADPSPARVAEFIDKNFTDARIGFLYTEADVGFAEQISTSLRGRKNELIKLKFNGNVFDGITDLTKSKIDLMLIGRNRDIYQPENIRFVLESLFRKKVPVITTSKQLVKAGAVASIAPSDDEVIAAIHRSVNALLKNEKVQARQFVDEVEIHTNRSMSEFYNWHPESVKK